MCQLANQHLTGITYCFTISPPFPVLTCFSHTHTHKHSAPCSRNTHNLLVTKHKPAVSPEHAQTRKDNWTNYLTKITTATEPSGSHSSAPRKTHFKNLCHIHHCCLSLHTCSLLASDWNWEHCQQEGHSGCDKFAQAQQKWLYSPITLRHPSNFFFFFLWKNFSRTVVKVTEGKEQD